MGQAEITDKLIELKAFDMGSGFTARQLQQELKGKNIQCLYRNLKDAVKNKRIQCGGFPTKYWVRK